MDVWKIHGKKTIKALMQTKSSLTSGITRTRKRLIERVNSLAADSLTMIDSVLEEQERIVQNDIKDIDALNDRMVTIHNQLQDFFGENSESNQTITFQTRDKVLSAKSGLKIVEEILQRNRLLKRNFKLVFYMSKEVEELQNNLTTFGELCVEDLTEKAKRPTSRPYSLHIGKVLADLDNTITNSDDLDDTLFAIHPHFKVPEDSLYCKIDTLPQSVISPPPLPPGANRQKMSTLPRLKKQVVYRKMVQSDTNDNLDLFSGTSNTPVATSVKSRNYKEEQTGVEDIANETKRSAEQLEQTDSGFGSISQSDFAEITSQESHKDFNQTHGDCANDQRTKPRSHSAVEMTTLDSDGKHTYELLTLPKRHSFFYCPDQLSNVRSQSVMDLTSVHATDSRLIFSPVDSKPQARSQVQSSSGSEADIQISPTSPSADRPTEKMETQKKGRIKSKQIGSDHVQNDIGISGLSVFDNNKIVICKPHENVVQLVDIQGVVLDEYDIAEPFGCCKVGDIAVAVTSRGRSSVTMFRVNGNDLRLWKWTFVNSCPGREMYGVGFAGSFLAIACQNKVVVLNEDDLKVCTVIQPHIPDKKKLFYQNVLFVELLLSDIGLDVFASDSKREVVSCTDAKTGVVKWTVSLNDPAGLIVTNGSLFVASKLRISVLKPENGRTLIEYRARAPKKPWAIAVCSDTFYVTRKAKGKDEASTVRAIPIL